jgi:FtsZ-binding cell division protein ZapB
MYQAYDSELLNQKESKSADSMRPDVKKADIATMTETPSHPLYVATRRLVKALDRLEGNLKSLSTEPLNNGELDQKVIHFEQENHALKQERENLNHSIAQLQRQYNDLQKVANSIYGKLDDSIQRLSQIIEE